jgi:hypothetical protein
MANYSIRKTLINIISEIFIKSTIFIFISLTSISIGFSKSKVVIEGVSSIIIESQNNDTHLYAGEIQAVLGGKLINTKANDWSDEINLVNSIDGIVKDFIIEQAYPNPFNPTTKIKYGVPSESNVDVTIYDITGRLVYNTTIRNRQPGWHHFEWRGVDSRSQLVSAGIYLVTMTVGDNAQKQMITFLK